MKAQPVVRSFTCRHDARQDQTCAPACTNLCQHSIATAFARHQGFGTPRRRLPCLMLELTGGARGEGNNIWPVSFATMATWLKSGLVSDLSPDLIFCPSWRFVSDSTLAIDLPELAAQHVFGAKSLREYFGERTSADDGDRRLVAGAVDRVAVPFLDHERPRARPLGRARWLHLLARFRTGVRLSRPGLERRDCTPSDHSIGGAIDGLREAQDRSLHRGVPRQHNFWLRDPILAASHQLSVSGVTSTSRGSSSTWPLGPYHRNSPVVNDTLPTRRLLSCQSVRSGSFAMSSGW